MTQIPIFRAAPEWLRELAAARTGYEELFGWPVSLHVTARRLTMLAGRTLDAVTMPAALGSLVQLRLRITMQDGPVIAGPRTGWLTFLTEPVASSDLRLPADLEHVSVRLVPRGNHVVLPIAYTASDVGEVRWFSAPRPRRAPPAWSVVIGACRWVVSSRRADQSPSRVPDQRAA